MDLTQNGSELIPVTEIPFFSRVSTTQDALSCEKRKRLHGRSLEPKRGPRSCFLPDSSHQCGSIRTSWSGCHLLYVAVISSSRRFRIETISSRSSSAIARVLSGYVAIYFPTQRKKKPSDAERRLGAARKLDLTSTAKARAAFLVRASSFPA